MSRKTIITLAASAIIGMGCLAMVSTDAFARGGRAGAGVGHAGVGVGHAGVGVARAPVRRGVAVGVGAAAVGAATYGAYARCGYSPYPPCY
jgi:hypothetical protein